MSCLDNYPMGVSEAISAAVSMLSGEPAVRGRDPRWQAIIAVGQFIEAEPKEVWSFIRHWGCHPQEDLRDTIATCLLEHLLEYHFGLFFPRVAKMVRADELFADAFMRCWQFGQAKKPGNKQRFAALKEWIRQRSCH